MSDRVLEYIKTHNISVFRDYRGPYIGMEYVAKALMLELINAGYADFLILKDDKVSMWWNFMVSTAQQKISEYEKKVELYNFKHEAWSKLTVDERKALKVRKPTPPKPI